ncbi:hypothetical protein [Archangium lipolyticum]|uniref:hypothetical protein n=1 Tax=Archangium lipolyticum TaxID=2970465 RepID=UPI00214A243A|nr:hypothetical protein [Archangium lipolyticum]
MRAEALAHRWAALLGAVLLCTGCVTLAPRQGGGPGEGVLAFSTLRDTGATALALEAPAYEVARVGPAPQEPPSCGGRAVPPGWPDFSSSREALLAPFLTCASPGEVLALQERVDMPRLLEALDDWRAVRLGALGPPREDVALLLNKKRTALLVRAPEAYGRLNAQVLAVFITDSAYDNDLREILFLLAQDKRLAETLALLPAFQVALEKRGLKPTARVDRDSELGDVGRGLVRAGRDALSSSPLSVDGGDFAFLPIRGQLPPEYQEALAKAEKEWVRNASADTLALSAFDHLTFGVPLGVYGLLGSTGQGLLSLKRGKYEEATRELAPAALLVAVHAGGKGLGYLAKGRGAAVEARPRALRETARQLQGVMGLEGLRDLVRHLQASREAGRFVSVGGADAALALYEARGEVARARPLMSRAKPGATGSPPVKSGVGAGTVGRQGTLASLVDEGVGHTPAVVEAKLAAAELEAVGPRLPKDVRVLEQHRPALDAPPPEARGNPRWREYVDYYERRLDEVKKGEAPEGPLKWEPYERMRGWFARGLAFERDMVKLLREDARKPRSQRDFLGDFDKPRVETQVGVRKPGPGLRYADVLVIEEGGLGGQPRRVETFSFKSRNLVLLEEEALKAQMKADASEALRNYGETLDIRRGSIQSLLPGGSEVKVSRARLIYEGGELIPKKMDVLQRAVDATESAVPGVEVVFQ